MQPFSKRCKYTVQAPLPNPPIDPLITSISSPPPHHIPTLPFRIYNAARPCSPAPPPWLCVNISLALCCIFISRSISAICCSSANASAHGTPSNNAEVDTTHSVLPPNDRPVDAQLLVVSQADDSARRCFGGTMSFSATRRS